MSIHLDRDRLRMEFDAAVIQLDQSRSGSKLTTDFYRRIGDSVFYAGYQALQDFVASCVGDHVAPNEAHRMHVVSAPVGSGKTSFSLAFVTALVRWASWTENKDAGAVPYGCLVVVNQIEKADITFRDLNALLPGKVAVWTTEHDPDCKLPKEGRKVSEPAAQFTKDDLQDYPVAVVTHAFFGGKGNRKGRLLLHKGKLQPRALTVIDERIEEVTIYDVALSSAQKVRETVLADEQHTEPVGPHMDELIKFMFDRSFEGPSIERPTDELEAWSIADRLQWFATSAASNFVRANSDDANVVAVFGFARALANGYAFIARNSGGGKATHYIGYESSIVINPGTVLLDATADIDGVVQLCPWRVPQDAPKARYNNLHVVSIPPLTKKRLTNYLVTAKNRRAYATWMVDTIKAHMKPGQRGLVICKLALIENENVPNWPEGDPRHNEKKGFTEEYLWEIEGRKLCVTHWGTGIGANTWKDAEVVFLFDEFWIPRRTIIATAQGLKKLKATQGPLADLKVLNSPNAAVDALWEGHLLRWLKQMALRGSGRCFDELGICGPQKLVCSADRTRLLSNFNRLFPGASIEVVTAPATANQSYADALLDILSRPGLPNVLSTKWIGQQMHTPWRNVSKHVMILEPVQRAIENLGWRYVSRKGRLESTFERIPDAACALDRAIRADAGSFDGSGNSTLALGGGIKFRLDQAQTRSIAVPN
jgi:hypothetical protein